MIKRHALIILLCLVVFIIRIIRIPIDPPFTYMWWDPAIYVGMGKLIFSHSTIGYWEILRPPLWPGMLGVLWKFGFDSFVGAKFLNILFSIGTILGIYFLGEKEQRGMGITAAIILATSWTYTFYNSIPTNDISAAFFPLVASIFLLRKKYFWAGLFVALAFLMRFPNGLFLIVFGLFILIEETQAERSKKILMLGYGFATIAIPYFIATAIVYKNPLLPIINGFVTVAHDPGDAWYYYILQLIVDNPLTILCILGFGIILYTYFKHKQRPSSLMTLVILCAIIVGGYFSLTGHKELRYSFAFLPFLVLIAGYGLTKIWQTLPQQNIHYFKIGSLCVLSIIGFSSLYVHQKHEEIIKISDARAQYYAFIPASAKTITSSPQILVKSDARIIGVFQSWIYGLVSLKEHASEYDYVAIDSCQVYCPASSSDVACTANQQAFNSMLKASTTKVFSAKDTECEFSIYKRITE